MFSDILKNAEEPESMFDAELYAEWIWHGDVNESDVTKLKESDFVDVVVEIETRCECPELAERICEIYYA